MFSAIIVVLAGLTLVAIFKKRKPVITVQTEKVTLRNITETVIANGQIQPVKQVVISPEVAGEITALPVKEGDRVKKGDLLVQIKPDNYIASRNSADAQYKSAIASKELAKAQLVKAETEYNRNQELFSNKLISASAFLDFKTQYEVAKLQYENAIHLEDQAKFGLDKAKDDLSKTTIVAPMDGTITRLESQPGERVLGTSFNMGTEIMTISDLNEMEALVDIGEMDVVLLKPGQKARLDVDAFKDRKFSGVITEIAISAKGSGLSAAQAANNSSQEATKFEAHIRVNEKDNLRPGMSVTAEIETRSRTNVLAVPIASVTMRIPKQNKADDFSANAEEDTNSAGSDKKSKEPPKQEYVVFVVEGDHVKMRPVKIGISDDDYYEITEGLKEGEKVVSGSYRAINHDLNDGTKITEAGSNRRRKKL
ncbi:MAG TPA: efflux RND transporter periplasmic adaptor subunit [Verrucomicrobiae bacterium]|nr:efflux RND transporter periplasmic adaptor subunit [Verrucomicrobiae bacterium]